MTTYKRRDCLMWLNAARRGWMRQFCLRHALALATDPNHAERITRAIQKVGIPQLDAILLAMAWLELECKVSALDYGPGSGIGFEHTMQLHQ